jgi:hypothetical protein
MTSDSGPERKFSCVTPFSAKARRGKYGFLNAKDGAPPQAQPPQKRSIDALQRAVNLTRQQQ